MSPYLPGKRIGQLQQIEDEVHNLFINEQQFPTEYADKIEKVVGTDLSLSTPRRLLNGLSPLSPHCRLPAVSRWAC